MWSRPAPAPLIEDPAAIRAILDHFAKQGALEQANYRPKARGPPAVAAWAHQADTATR
jgi:hypothetical protein